MKFEEEFPSLKGQVYDANSLKFNCDWKLHKYVPLVWIREHCLDKQKVKDVIDNPKTFPVILKLRAEDYVSFSEKCYKAERYRIKKELGLE